MMDLIYSTNNKMLAQISDEYGIDRVMVDLERIGKVERQQGWNSVISNHCIADIAVVKSVLKKSKLLVRTNSIYDGSKEEIEEVLSYEPWMIALPYATKPEEVKQFIDMVAGRSKVGIMIENKEAVAHIDEILSIPGIDEIYIGLNDLGHSYGKTFLFECLSCGLVEEIINKIRAHGISCYGFGGVGKVGTEKLPAEKIIIEHYRLKSTCVILSRSFYRYNENDTEEQIRKIFKDNLKLCHDTEVRASAMTPAELEANRLDVVQIVNSITEQIEHNGDNTI